jgi:glucose-6-phosphate isomerase
MGFSYGTGVFGPEVENRRLDDIRKSLADPACDGPETVYSIAMDVGKEEHRALLNDMHLLYGAVTYAMGKLGDEPIRSQGHIHARSPLNGLSTPEVYEIWSGSAIIYMQERVDDDIGRCYAVYASAGRVVIVPPGWVHATINADPSRPMTFGAWCDREYGFDYSGVRSRNGIAWFPLFGPGDRIEWRPNPAYGTSELICKDPSDYAELGIRREEAIYRTFEREPETFLYVPRPDIMADVWADFVP